MPMAKLQIEYLFIALFVYLQLQICEFASAEQSETQNLYICKL